MSVDADILATGAVLDPTGTYRYRLWRRWADGPTATWIMLNPSTADATQDDPTIRRCRGFAKRWGYGGIMVVNLYALRTTRPVHLWTHPDPIGPDNADAIESACSGAGLIVAAWGAHGARNDEYGFHTARRIAEHCGPVYCLGTTRTGQPRHPLYVRGDTPALPYVTATGR